MTTHTGRHADSACTVCAPLIEAAQAAQAESESAQGQVAGRGSARYTAARAGARTASAALVAAKREHYRTVR